MTCPASLITHEHTDHIAGLAVLLKSYPIPLYATPGTALVLSRKLPHARELIRPLPAGSRFQVGESDRSILLHLPRCRRQRGLPADQRRTLCRHRHRPGAGDQPGDGRRLWRRSGADRGQSRCGLASGRPLSLRPANTVSWATVGTCPTRPVRSLPSALAAAGTRTILLVAHLSPREQHPGPGAEAAPAACAMGCGRSGTSSCGAPRRCGALSTGARQCSPCLCSVREAAETMLSVYRPLCGQVEGEHSIMDAVREYDKAPEPLLQADPAGAAGGEAAPTTPPRHRSTPHWRRRAQAIRSKLPPSGPAWCACAWRGRQLLQRGAGADVPAVGHL